jgi:hypothetical protein
MRRGAKCEGMTDSLKPYDPRPEWMLQYHKEVEGGSNQFKEWAHQNLNIDIDDQLKYDQGTGKADVAAWVLEAVAKQIPFILHNGPKRFCVIIPKLLIIATYTPNGNTTEILDVKQFQNRVKMLYVIYPHFSPATLKLVQSALELAITHWSEPKKLT